MSQPVIGITTYGQNEEHHFTLPREYIDSVRRAGGVPLLISPGESEIDRVLEVLDGLMLAGGGDLDPAHYGGTQHETGYMVDAERDASEIDLARAAINKGTPTFGICRGIQVINIALGGTLFEHLPDVVGDEIDHRLPPREPTEHIVKVKAESRLGGILAELEFTSASWHHQAIRDVASPLEVVAHAPDGIIEAVESSDHPWLIGVQWHPELTAATDPVQQRLFNEFASACLR